MNPLATVLTWLSIVSATSAGFVSMCYFTSWSFERPIKEARFSTKDVDPFLCSHLIYAFVNIDPTDLVLKSSSHYAEFNKLKLKNKNLKTLISVGGQHTGSKVFASVASKTQNIANFAKTSAKFLRDHEFDGIDIDWEYPSVLEDTRDHFTALLKGLRQEFDQEARDFGRPRLIISIAVAAGKKRIDEGYDVEKISRYVDYINIMAYDYFGPWNKISGFNSPLYPRKSNPRFSEELNMKWTVDAWLKKKAPREKIIVGMTAVGCSFTLNDTDSHDVGALVDGGGEQGTMYLEEGRLMFPEICQMENEGGIVVYDEEQQVPYLYKDDQWIGFDNVRSIQTKVKWMIGEGFAGAMFWAMDMDDFSGKFCKKGKFPLLNAMKDIVVKDTLIPIIPAVPKEVTYTRGTASKIMLSSILAFLPTFVYISLIQVL